MDKHIKNGIRDARQTRGLSVSELALKFNVDPSIIEGWESGAITPALETVKKLAQFLDVSMESLLFSEKRHPLTLEGLSKEAKQSIRRLYEDIKNI